jgi:hypothetical protein
MDTVDPTPAEAGPRDGLPGRALGFYLPRRLRRWYVYLPLDLVSAVLLARPGGVQPR